MKLFFCISLLFILTACNNKEKWQTINTESSCTVRHECGFVSHKGHLYLIGGRGIKPIDRYNISNNHWSSMQKTPFEMSHITPVSVNNNIYIVTGFTGSYPKEDALTHVYTYTPEDEKWTSVLEIPIERRRGAAGITVHNNKIYIVNGITNGHTDGTSNMFDVYDPIENTWSILPNAPNNRDHSATAVINNTLISIGGRNTSYHEPSNFEAFFSKTIDAIDYFNFDTNKWETYKIKLPNPAAGAGVAILNKELYFIGGETDNKIANNKVYAFNTETKQWTKKPFLNTGRHGTNAVVYNNKIYIASGSGNKGGGPELNSIEVY